MKKGRIKNVQLTFGGEAEKKASREEEETVN